MSLVKPRATLPTTPAMPIPAAGAMGIINDQKLTRTQRNEKLGAIKGDGFIDGINLREFNLVFIKQLNENLTNAGLGTDFTNPKNRGDEGLMYKIMDDTAKNFLKGMVLQNLTTTGGMTKEQADVEYTRLQKNEPKKIIALGKQESGKSNVELFIEQNRLLMNQRVEKSTLELAHIMDRLNDSIKYVGITSQDSVKDLNNIADILSGTFQIQSNSAEKDVSKLSNLQALKPGEFKGVLDRSLSLLGITDKTDLRTSNKSPVNDQMIGLVTGTAEIRKNLPELLRSASVDVGVGGDSLEVGTAKEIGESIRALLEPLKLEPGTSEDIVKQSIGAVQAGAGKGTLLNMDDLLKQVPSLGMAFETSTKITTVLQSAQEEYLKTIESLNAVTNRMIGISSKINEANSKSILKKSQDSIEMKEIFGDVISLRERNSGFEDSIKELTKNSNNPQGTSDVGSIVAALKKAQADLINLNNEEPNKANVDQRTVLGTTINGLNSALEQMANSGVKASNALNKIAEIQKIMASRLSLFERLATGDMSALIDVQRSVDDFRIFTDPNTTDDRRRKMNMGSVLKGKQISIEANPDKIDAITNALINSLKGFSLGAELAELLIAKENTPLKEATSELDKARIEEAEARAAINGMLKDELAYLKNNTIFQTFQTEMATQANEIVKAMAEAAERIKNANNNKPASQQQDLGVSSNNEINEAIKNTNTEARAKYNKATYDEMGINSSADMATSGMGVFMSTKKEQFKPITTADQAYAEVTKRLNDNADTKSKNSNMFLPSIFGDREMSPSENKALVERQKILEKVVEKQKNDIIHLKDRRGGGDSDMTSYDDSSGSQFIRPKAPTTTGGPMSIPPERGPFGPRPNASSTSAPQSAESAALLKGTADLKLVISSLANVFPTLNDPINKFKSSVDNLLKGLSDFNANGGIKGPNIPESVVVNVKFDEKLAIDTTSMRTEDLLSQIGVITRDAIATKWKELTRVNG